MPPFSTRWFGLTSCLVGWSDSFVNSSLLPLFIVPSMPRCYAAVSFRSMAVIARIGFIKYNITIDLALPDSIFNRRLRVNCIKKVVAIWYHQLKK